MQRPGGFVNGSKLHKGIVSLHIDAGELSVGLEEHAKIFLFGSFFVKVDDEQGLGRLYVLAAIVFFALDASVAPGKFHSQGTGDSFKFPEVHSRCC